MRIVYGPVISWRLGRSLGIDPIAARSKQCPFSCIYCQYGETAQPTFRRREYVGEDRLRAELGAVQGVAADVVTFAGLGEPTLAANLPALLAVARERTQLPVVLLTGGALIADPRVRADVSTFDQVIVTVNAPDEALFRRINRPPPSYPYSPSALVDGLCRLRQSVQGKLVIQVMLIGENVNAAPALARLVERVAPDEVYLNTPLRPALGGPISRDQMRAAAECFRPPFRTAYDEPPAFEQG